MSQNPPQNLCQNNYAHYLTAMLISNPKKRAAVTTLYNFHHEISKIPTHVTDPMMGRIRLQWWRDNLEQNTAAHPLLTPLTKAINDYTLPKSLFTDFINATESTLSPDFQPSTMAALETHLTAANRPTMQLALQILNHPTPLTPNQIKAATAMSLACALIKTIENFPTDRQHRRLYLPKTLLKKHNLTPKDLLDFTPNPTKLTPLFQTIANTAKTHLKTARQYKKHIPKTLHPALLTGTIAQTTLKALAKNNDTTPKPTPLKAQLTLALAVLLGRY